MIDNSGTVNGTVNLSDFEKDILTAISQNPNYSIEKNEFGSSYVVIPGYDEFYLYLSDSDLNNEKTAEYILAKFYRDIGESIKHYEEIYYKYVNSIYLIIDKSDAESYSLEKYVVLIVVMKLILSLMN